MTTPVDLDALEEAARRATPGPWMVERTKLPLTEKGEHLLAEAPYKEWAYSTIVTTAWEHGQLKRPMPIVETWKPVSDSYQSRDSHASMRPHNAEYIATASPDRILALCGEVRRLRGEVERLRAQG